VPRPFSERLFIERHFSNTKPDLFVKKSWPHHQIEGQNQGEQWPVL
jgi:hypothetical protein